MTTTPAQPATPALQAHRDAADHGLICGWKFLPGGPAVDLATLEAVQQAMEAPGEGFVWLHFNLSHTGSLRWLRQNAGLTEAFFEALGEGSRSARIEREGDTLFAVLNDVVFDFSLDAQEVETLWLSVGRRLVVSARLRPLRSVDRLRTAVKRGERLDTSVDLLDHLLRDQADELQRILRHAAERLDDIEDEVLSGRHEKHAAELARLRRMMVRLQRLLTPEPTALARCLSRPPEWMQASDAQQLARSNEEFTLVLRDVATLQDRIRLLQDEAAARVAGENNRSLFTLTMVTVLALPINLVSGLFGMNVGGIPLAEHPTGFWIMLALIATVTGVIARVAIRRLRGRE
jgi:zinc transporter